MNPLFTLEPLIFDLPDAEILYYPSFFDTEMATSFYTALKNEIPWRQDDIKVYGKTYAQPRLTALFGTEGQSYTYSNITMNPHSWTPLLSTIKAQIEQVSQVVFNTVLINLYRDGTDSNGWHADNEKELGANPIIASISFGAERVFQLKHNSIPKLKQNIVLEHGSLLLMKGTTQHFWKHQIPKTAKQIDSRINLTFRVLI